MLTVASKNESAVKAYLGQYAADLPGGCKMYHISTAGKIFVAADGKVQEISPNTPEYVESLHTFINPGNLAHYLLGTPETSDENPTNATVKFGITDPHHHFIPHAHGVEHWVYSAGFSGCIMFDTEKKRAVIVKCIPGTLVFIAAMIPHLFYNRSDSPLLTLISNAGLGIHHEKYAITEKIAHDLLEREHDSAKRTELYELIGELGSMNILFTATHPEQDMSLREHVSEKLYRLAELVGVGL